MRCCMKKSIMLGLTVAVLLAVSFPTVVLAEEGVIEQCELHGKCDGETKREDISDADLAIRLRNLTTKKDVPFSAEHREPDFVDIHRNGCTHENGC